MDSRDIRTFCIIAHIDHGKTTLTDRLLEATGSVAERDRMDRMMDSNPIERERGITIKLAPVTMQYGKYTLNLIDTPGHVDFGYEVSRSLAACEGVLLVVDATQGGLKIIPVLNKIDLPASEPERVTLELMELFGFSEEEVIPVSAKTGLNMDKLLEAIVKFIPAPKGELEKPPRALVFTSQFDVHKGVIAYIRMIDGSLKDGEMLHMMGTQVEFESIEMGHFLPKMSPGKTLSVGEVGYVCTGLKSVKEVNVGDTMTSAAAAARVVPLADSRRRVGVSKYQLSRVGQWSTRRFSRYSARRDRPRASHSRVPARTDRHLSIRPISRAPAKWRKHRSQRPVATAGPIPYRGNFRADDVIHDFYSP
jgi:GTP-binding protein LepA